MFADLDGGSGRHPAGTAGRRWPVVALIVAALVAAAAIPLAGMWASSRPPQAVPVNPVPTPNPVAPPPSDSASPAPSSSPSASPSPSAGTRSSAAPRPAPPPRQPPIAPVTYEAEAPGNDLGGSAWVDDYPGASGGRIVRNLGRWQGMGSAGSLRFTNVAAPVTGTYLLTFFYVHLDGDPVRSVVVTVSGSAPVELTVTGSDTCCSAARLRVTLLQGSNTITFSQPDGHAPSLDKIVISAS